jgi:cobaltochelatase CobT
VVRRVQDDTLGAVVEAWYEWAAVALFALYFLAMLWKGPSPPSPMPLDPSKPYQVFCRDFDVEVESEQLDSALGLTRNSLFEVRHAEMEEHLPAWRRRHHVAVLETAKRIRATTGQDALDDTVVSLLIDHSGSMRGLPMLYAAEAVMTASDLLESLGATQEVLGFTTVRWQGGRSREKWLDSGRPAYPGRLCDVLHVVYCSAGERPHARHYATMQRLELLKENLDGEAVQWAASRLHKCAESRKYLIVVSDGAPVDDSTIAQNGGAYLVNHLLGVIEEIAQAGDIQLAAIGIGHAVDRYYERSVAVHSAADDVGAAALRLIEQLLCTPTANA